MTGLGVTSEASRCLSNKAVFSSSSRAKEVEGIADARQRVIATNFLLGMLEQSLQMFAWKEQSDFFYGGLRADSLALITDCNQNIFSICTSLWLILH